MVKAPQYRQGKALGLARAARHGQGARGIPDNANGVASGHANGAAVAFGGGVSKVTLRLWRGKPGEPNTSPVCTLPTQPQDAPKVLSPAVNTGGLGGTKRRDGYKSRNDRYRDYTLPCTDRFTAVNRSMTRHPGKNGGR